MKGLIEKLIKENEAKLEEIKSLAYEFKPLKLNNMKEVIEKLNQLNTKTESTETDPRWAALSKLKDKSK
jgi:uncharacterized metal-binding protein YceD (DUF177 family)